jgi:hypothetical protein
MGDSDRELAEPSSALGATSFDHGFAPAGHQIRVDPAGVPAPVGPRLNEGCFCGGHQRALVISCQDFPHGSGIG